MGESATQTKRLAETTQSELNRLSVVIAGTSSNLQQRIELLDARLQQSEKTETQLQTTLLDAQKALSELKLYSEFVLVAASAQADDRAAYQQLVKWSQDNNYHNDHNGVRLNY